MASPVSHFQVPGKIEILNAHSEGKISKWHWCKIHICKLHMLFRYWQWVWQMKKVTNILTPSLPKHDTSWLWIGVFIVLLYFKDWSIANVLDWLHSLISTSEVSANCNSYFFKKLEAASNLNSIFQITGIQVSILTYSQFFQAEILLFHQILSLAEGFTNIGLFWLLCKTFCSINIRNKY